MRPSRLLAALGAAWLLFAAPAVANPFDPHDAPDFEEMPATALPIGVPPGLLDIHPEPAEPASGPQPLDPDAPPLPNVPEIDDCGCDAPAVLPAQATASVPAPATLTVVQDGQTLRVEAEEIEGLLDDGPIEARGRVFATYGDIRLTADMLRFDRQTGKGLASGSVVVIQPPQRLEAESLTFDMEARQAELHRWRGVIPGQVQGHGRLLSVEASRSIAYDSSFTPCLAENPGYRFDFAQFEMVPRGEGRSTITGRHAIVRLSGVPVFWFPYFWLNLPLLELPELFEGREFQTRLRIGYDKFDGWYATTTGNYELAPGWVGRVPVRATTKRGITVGVEQHLPLEVVTGRLDAFYTTPFPGNAKGFLPGPRANLSLQRKVFGGTALMAVGYRVDVNNPFRIGPYPSLSNMPVSRLPELAYSIPTTRIGPLRVTPSVRAAYLIEDNGRKSPRGEAILSLRGPTFELPAGIRLGSYGSLRGNVYRELNANERAAGDAFLGRLARGVGQAGLSASTNWWGFRLSGTAEAVRVQSSTPASFLGTPFVHDRISPQDRLNGSISRQLFGPFSASISGSLARPHNAEGPRNWVPSDARWSLRYAVGCVTVGYTYRPLIEGWDFSYSVTAF